MGLLYLFRYAGCELLVSSNNESCLSRRGEPGVWGGGSYTGVFERWMKEGSLLGNSKIC